MPTHAEKRVLPWSPDQMFALVADVASYPDFLPWCDRAEVLEQHDDGMTARIGLHYMGVRHAFTTRNVQVPGRSVE